MKTSPKSQSAASKAQKKDLYSDLPTSMQFSQSDIPRYLKKHLEDHDLAYKWLNSIVLDKRNNIHHAEYRVWTCPDSLRDEMARNQVPLASDGTLRKGGDLVLGIQTKAVQKQRREHLAKKNRILAGQVAAKKQEFKEKVQSEGVGHSVDMEYGEE